MKYSKFYKTKENDRTINLWIVSMSPSDREVARCFYFSNINSDFVPVIERMKQNLKVASKWVELDSGDFA